MIIRKNRPQNDQGTENRAEHYGAFELLRYSQAPAGTANGHQVLNRSNAACTYVIVGTRAPRDVVPYQIAERFCTTKGTDGACFAPMERC